MRPQVQSQVHRCRHPTAGGSGTRTRTHEWAGNALHQGDGPGAKAAYPINAVETVTQREVAGCAREIGEQYFEPVLEGILHQVPFVISGFTPSTPITQWPGCWGNYRSNSPRPAPTEPRTMRWWTDLNRHLNFHRPCGYATVSLDSRGKRTPALQVGRLRYTLGEAEVPAGGRRLCPNRASTWRNRPEWPD